MMQRFTGSIFGVAADALVSTGLDKLGYTYVNIGNVAISLSFNIFKFQRLFVLSSIIATNSLQKLTISCIYR